MTRDVVIKGLERCIGKISCNGCPLERAEGDCALTLLSEALALLKSEPKRGRWVEEEDVFGDTTYVCSVCGEPWTLIEGTPAENNMYYCPNCGAKMGEDTYKGG